MAFVCNLPSIHSLANVVVLFRLKTCQPCYYIKQMSRERRVNKNTQRSLGYLWKFVFYAIFSILIMPGTKWLKFKSTPLKVNKPYIYSLNFTNNLPKYPLN